MKTYSTKANLLVLILFLLVTYSTSNLKGARFIKLSKANSELVFFQLSAIRANGENIAKGKPVTAASPYGNPNYLTNEVGYNYAGSYQTQNSWVMIDLEAEYHDIIELIFVNRPDCCPSRNLNAKLELLDGNKKQVDHFTITSNSNILKFETKYGKEWEKQSKKCEHHQYIKKIRLACNHGKREYLNVMEIQLADRNNQLIQNMFLRATMSSLYSSSYPASNFIDGNRYTMAHTLNNMNEFIEVELVRSLDNIKYIILENRRDVCCRDRLTGCSIYLIDEFGSGLQKFPINYRVDSYATFYPACTDLSYKKKKKLLK